MIVLGSGDKIRGDAAAGSVIDYTMFGLDNNALTQLADGQLSDSTADMYTADSTDVITSLIIVNTDSSPRAVNLYLLPSGGTARRIIPKDMVLGAGYSLHWAGDKITVMNASGETVITSSSWDGDIGDIDLDGGADIGAALADADLILVDDGAAGTNRKSAISRLWTYIVGKLAAVTDVSGYSWVIDEDAMGSDLDTKVPTQQSVKAYVDSITPNAHKDSHDPEDGADALDTAAPSELAGVQASAQGSAHSFARSDHAHQIQHSIADNHIITVDDADAAENDYARFTANGLQGRSAAEAKTDLGFIEDLADDTSPQLGGTLDINEQSVQYEFGTLTSDQTASGDIISATAGENLSFGDVCYFKASDGKFWKTDADAVATSKGMLAMAIATINADASGLFLLRGLARDDTWDWSMADQDDAELYLDTATAGALTETAPSGTGDIVRIAGYARAADYVWFDPDGTYVEVP